MKKYLWIMLLFLTFILYGCTTPTENNVETPLDTPIESPVETPVETGPVTMTLEELAQFDGRDGRDAYIAVNGVIYDVTGSPRWPNGRHNGYQAGQDLTSQIQSISPHGTSVLDNLPIVGTLVSEGDAND